MLDSMGFGRELVQNPAALTDDLDSSRYSPANDLSSLHSLAQRSLRFQTVGTSGNDQLRITRDKTALYGLEGNDLMLGMTGVKSVLFGNDGRDQIRGGNRQDVLNGGSSRDELLGNDGNDLLVGGSGGDLLIGNRGRDTLRGESGNDSLNGGNGADYLDGGAGFDRLTGGAGNDQLKDYEGGDRLTGGQGADRFGVGSPLAAAPSRITDFQPGVDQLQILRLGATFGDLTVEARKSGTAVLDQGRVIVLISGIKPSRLKPTSFIFGDAQAASSSQASLDQMLSASPTITGSSAASFNSDGTLWLGSAGLSDRQSQTPVDANSLFGIGSITKTMIATTILQLRQEGRLSLTDTLSQWLPNIARHIPNSNQITIRELLQHTSGIQDYLNSYVIPEFEFVRDPAIWSQKVTTKYLLSIIEDKPAWSKPGQAHAYSNTNYILLGEIIEKATGTKLVNQLHQRIFEPLGMKETFYAPQEAVQGNLTHTYIDLNGDGQLDDFKDSLFWYGAAGGVVSTAADLAKFSQALFQGDLLAPDSLQAMINKNVSDDQNGRYGLGLIISYSSDLGLLLGHTGGIIGWKAGMKYSPNRRITYTMLYSQPLF